MAAGKKKKHFPFSICHFSFSGPEMADGIGQMANGK